jgi:hypothetical protein
MDHDPVRNFSPLVPIASTALSLGVIAGTWVWIAIARIIQQAGGRVSWFHSPWHHARVLRDLEVISASEKDPARQLVQQRLLLAARVLPIWCIAFFALLVLSQL